MLDIVTEALAMPGLWFVALGALLAGVVRGFSGFGTAMIYLPFAAQVMPPVWAILSMIAMDIISPLPLVPSALRIANKRDLSLLLLGTLCLMPVGLALLALMSGDTYRYVVSAISLCVVALLVCGVRYKGTLSNRMILGIGGMAGFSGGLSGVPGPPVILFYMASTLPVAVIRANMLLFLVATDFIIMAALGARGELSLTPLVIGLAMAIPGLVGNVAGAAIFNPDKAGLYRNAAYVVVAASALMGLPIWGN